MALIRPRALARLMLALVSMSVALAAGCIVPEDLEGPNDHAPRVDLLRVLPDPQQILASRQSPAGGPRRVDTFQLVVVDPDPQTLWLRGFIDALYDRRVDIVSDQIRPAALGDGRRPHLFDIEGLCDEKVNSVLGEHVLEVYISDTGFVDAGADLRVSAAGGFRDSIMWRFRCDEALVLVPSDAGI